MSIPVEISFKGVPHSLAVESRIHANVQKLERFHDRIRRCHVTVETPHHHHQTGRLYQVRVLINVPTQDIAVTHEGPQDPAHEDVNVAIRDAFDAVTRRLQDYVQKRRTTRQRP
jgi:ribosome-associated translation inhibitor RaiA